MKKMIKKVNNKINKKTFYINLDWLKEKPNI